MNRWHLARKDLTYAAIFILLIMFLNFLEPTQFLLVIFLIATIPWFLYKGFTKPSFFVLILTLFTLYRAQELFPAIMEFRLILILGCLSISSLLLNVLLKRTQIYWSKDLSLFLGFFFWITLSAAVAFNSGSTLDFLFNSFLKIAVVFFLICWTLENRQDFLSFLLVSLLSGLILSAIIGYNKYNDIGIIEKARVTLNLSVRGLAADPNDLSCLLLVPFGMSLGCLGYSATSTLLRLSGLICSIIIASGIIFTQSRGGMLGLAAVTICFFLQKIKSKNLVLLIGCLFIIGLYTLTGIDERQSGLSLDESADNRIEAWKGAVKIALDHPLFGVGINEFSNYFYLYRPYNSMGNMVAHSSWFTVLAETGFIGLFLFISCIYMAFKSIRDIINRLNKSKKLSSENTVYLILANGIFLGLIGYCVAGSFLTQSYGFIFFSLFAVSIALSRRVNKII